jgi:L-threonylcarbamoyladenylate synthase
VKGPQNTVAAHIKQLCALEAKPCVMVLEERAAAYPGLRVYSLGSDLSQAAHRLFDLLRRADEAGCSRILAEALPEDGLGLALMNRLSRAADFDIQSVQNDGGKP